MDKAEIIRKIEEEYEKKQLDANDRKYGRIKELYEKYPSLMAVDKEINETGTKGIEKILRNPENSLKNKRAVTKKLKELAAKKDEILKKNGISENYNKPVFECEKCSDTGYLKDGKRCECFEKEIAKYFYENSNLGRMINEADFENFSLSYYPETSKKSGENPRKIAAEALEYIQYFCENTDRDIHDIYIYGNTGLGKTFLCAAAAKKVMDIGKNVNYIRAPKLFSLYEEYKFKNYDLKSKIDEFYECDLLIIDDLGSELITKTGVAFFFDLLDERLIGRKKIIINTNLDPASFSKTYTVRAMSRIYENFKIFRLEGDDIRIKKLMEK